MRIDDWLISFTYIYLFELKVSKEIQSPISLSIAAFWELLIKMFFAAEAKKELSIILQSLSMSPSLIHNQYHPITKIYTIFHIEI